MSDTQSDFLSRLAQRVADSDAQAAAAFADIMAGKPFKKRDAPPKPKAEKKSTTPKKPRAKRKPKKTETDE